jgi:hypothetical protein
MLPQQKKLILYVKYYHKSLQLQHKIWRTKPIILRKVECSISGINAMISPVPVKTAPLELLLPLPSRR